MKNITKSKTINFNIIMAMVASVHGSIHLMQPLLTSEHFAIVSLVIGAIHAMGGVYLRTITTQALSDK